MKAIYGFPCIVLLACAALPASGQYVYVRSNLGQPWGQSTNENAMDSVLGAGNWTTQYYETVDVNSLLSSSNTFIFLEGGDSSYGEVQNLSDGIAGSGFSNFVAANLTALSNWVSSGGRLLIMSAPNNPLNSEVLTLPDNITLYADAYYVSAASSAYATQISSPIFSGPNSTAYYFTGDFFSHGYFTGSNLTAIMVSNLNEVVLGQDSSLGLGLMVLGGMTTDNFDLPQPASHALLENIIYYTVYTTL